MIKLASKRFLNVDFIVQNILEEELIPSDYYICSGAMNILEEKEVFIFIKKCFDSSKIAFVFNFLKNDSLTSVDINKVLEYCQSLTKNISIKDNYLDNDVSILLKK